MSEHSKRVWHAARGMCHSATMPAGQPLQFSMPGCHPYGQTHNKQVGQVAHQAEGVCSAPPSPGSCPATFVATPGQAHALPSAKPDSCSSSRASLTSLSSPAHCMFEVLESQATHVVHSTCLTLSIEEDAQCSCTHHDMHPPDVVHQGHKVSSKVCGSHPHEGLTSRRPSSDTHVHVMGLPQSKGKWSKDACLCVASTAQH